MAEKLIEVYEQYDMNVISVGKGRGATLLTTDKGHRILEPFRGNIIRLEQEYVLKGLFINAGFSDLDSIIPNKDGQLISCDRYRQPFVLKRHFDGRECDMKELSDVLKSIKALAKFHIAGKSVAGKFKDAWEDHEKEREEKKIADIKKAVDSGEELEKIARIFDIRESVLREILRQAENGSEMTDDRARIVKNKSESQIVYKDISDVFERHNKEIKKISKYIIKVKQKNSFETLFLQVFPEYHKQGLECTGMLADENVAKGVYEKHYGICHGSFNQHNVLLCEDFQAIVHFERFSKGNQLDDLYQFSRKVMEKNHFDIDILEEILNGYNKLIPLDKEDFRYIYVLFSYPEKFWKIANSYYNSNKAFLSPKFVEKLEAVILQEKEKREMLDKFFSFHLN